MLNTCQSETVQLAHQQASGEGDSIEANAIPLDPPLVYTM